MAAPSAFGVDTSRAHLDNIDSANDGIDWQRFHDWNRLGTENYYPSFAGRYFVCDSLFKPGASELSRVITWGRGEGSNIPDSVRNSLKYIAPLQASLQTRQSTKGIHGFANGIYDGLDVCNKLSALISTGELQCEEKVNVFLDIASGTDISEEYWLGWGQAVTSYVGQSTDPSDYPRMIGAFVPCIACDFEKFGLNMYYPNQKVKDCLENAGKKYKDYSGVICHGFWAKTPDNPTYRNPFPTLDWSEFLDYRQPVGDPARNFTVPVHVLIWRYAEYKPNDPLAGGQKFSMDAIHEPYFGKNCMLEIQDRQLIDMIQPNFTYGGIDSNLKKRDCNEYFQITEERAHALVDKSVIVDGEHTYPVKFFIGYYRPRGYSTIITESSIQNLNNAGIRFVANFQGGTDRIEKSTYDENYGLSDGRAAFSYAKEICQPANTPIYFSIDVNTGAIEQAIFDPSIANDKRAIDGYFKGIWEAYREYLNDTRNLPDPVPYSIGVYSTFQNKALFDYCYKKGYASYFWFAYWDTDYERARRRFFPHSNIWQIAGDKPFDFSPNAATKIDMNISWLDEGSWNWNDTAGIE